jgi:outer membrane protein assembly factor BamB
MFRLPMLFVVTLASVSLADWPHLRGRAYDGVSAERNLADAWPTQGPPQLWSRELGQGHSGFIVAEDRLFTQRQTVGGQFLLCMNPETGETLWETRIDWAWQPRGAYPGPYATPTYADGKIFFSSPTGIVGCLDARSGQQLWSLNLRTKFKGTGFDFGYAITPTIEDGRVLLPVGGPDASVVALETTTGRTLWATGSDPASYCPILPINVGPRRCVVGYLQNAIVLLDLVTGKQLYRESLSSGYDEHSAWPIYQEPHLVLLAPFRAPATRWRLRELGDDRLKVTTDWISREMSNDVASSVRVGDFLYGFDLREAQSSKHRASRGTFKCLEWATGKARWSAKSVGQACVVVADSKLYLLNDTGQLIMAEANAELYMEKGRVSLFEGEICWTPPTIAKGRLYARGPSRMVCLWVGRAEDLQGTAQATPRVLARSWSWDATWLMPREREYPNDMPSWEESVTWFVWSCAILAGSGLVACVLRRGRRLVFVVLIFALGLFGSSVLSLWLDRCVFTWPVAVFGVYAGTVWVCMNAAKDNTDKRAGWLARGAIVGLLLVAWGYVELCRGVGMFICWSYLAGLLPALLPVWLGKKWRESIGSDQWGKGLWGRIVEGGLLLMGFGVLFWSGQALLLWKVG